MTRMVRCAKLDKEAEGLGYQVYPGELGKRIYANVSKEAWQMWLKHQTILINENRLSPIEPKARQFLEKEMEKFFFGEGSDLPAEFVSPEQSGKH
jgi:Fe-S cluster biosynthesis and repair protein YggX